jgi:hypothetical protein
VILRSYKFLPPSSIAACCAKRARANGKYRWISQSMVFGNRPTGRKSTFN